MKTKKIFTVLIFLFSNLSQVLADERKSQLNKLFEELKFGNSALTSEVEQRSCNEFIFYKGIAASTTGKQQLVNTFKRTKQELYRCGGMKFAQRQATPTPFEIPNKPPRLTSVLAMTKGRRQEFPCRMSYMS